MLTRQSLGTHLHRFPGQVSRHTGRCWIPFIAIARPQIALACARVGYAQTRHRGPSLSGQVTIRRATAADAQAISEVHLRSWHWAYRGLIPDAYLDRLAAELPTRIERFRARLASEAPDERTWIALQGERIVGFAITATSGDSDATRDVAEVRSLYLAPEAAGQGIGRALFAHAVADLRDRGYRQATLWVLESNARARGFYAAAGWSPDGATKVEERPETLLREVRYRTFLSRRPPRDREAPP
jgi:ribosomal protein S18 acetylase RimI-like enzyme